jgi:hypothetical protein
MAPRLPAMARWRFALVALVAGSLVWATGSASASTRFHAYVGGVATGPGHRFVVGDGLNLVFIDAFRSYTSYRVCWTRGAGRRCWHRTTGGRKHKSVIFTAAPSNIGTYRATWYVESRAVASWTFHNGTGD